MSTRAYPTSQGPTWSHAVRVGLGAGLAAGVVVLVPTLVLQASRGIGVVPEMQLAASGVEGLRAYAGPGGLLLGIVLHFLVSVVPAIAYASFAKVVPAARRLPWIGGPVLGLGVFVVMGLVVLPASAFTVPPGVTPMPFLPALLIHLFALGLPIALVVRRRL